MENKQKAIKLAWGIHYSNDVDENGFRFYNEFLNNQLNQWSGDYWDKGFNENTKEYWVRPKSLQGIETNNGWIDFSVLPNDDKIYYFTAKNNFIFNVPQNLRMVIEKFINKEITHYYPIEQPKQKIY